jgi:serine acetyltransferase
VGAEPEIRILSHSNWQEPNQSAPLLCWPNLVDDALAHLPPQHRPRSFWYARLALMRALLRWTGVRVMLLHRLAHTARGHLGFPGRVIAAVLTWILRHFYACTISPRARLYGGLVLPHPFGIVIGPEVTVGPRAWIFQNVTLGGVPGKEGMPWVGADARLFTGAFLGGPIRIGDNVFIAANTVVSSDVPSRTMIRPAEAIWSELPDRYVVRSEPRRDD